MEGKLVPALGVMAVMIDPAARSVEAVDVDRVRVVSFSINAIDLVAQFVLGFGSVASDDRFRLDPQRQASLAHLSIIEPTFTSLFLDNGSLRRNYPKAFFDDLFATVLLPLANERVWGLTDIEVQMNGVTVFRQAPPPAEDQPLYPPSTE
jgi:hypothetical protein